MAAPRLLAKTDLTAFAPVSEGGRPVIEQHARLAALLAARGLVPGLFAEPVITRAADGTPSSASWYGEADADPVPLSSLSPARRAEVERALGAAVTQLLPALDDADGGALLRRALLIAEPDAILSVDGGVVLTGWGLVPRGTGAGADALARELAAGLGRYHPALGAAGAGFFAGAPLAAATAATATTAAPPTTPGTPAGAAPLARPPVPPPPGHPPPPAAGGSPAWWWMVPAALAIALIFLLLGLWLGLRLCTAEFAGRELLASVVQEGEVRAALERQREANSLLEREIAAARAALQGDICRPAGPLAPASGAPAPGPSTPPASTPPASTPPALAPATPTTPAPASPPPQAPSGGAAEAPAEEPAAAGEEATKAPPGEGAAPGAEGPAKAPEAPAPATPR